MDTEGYELLHRLGEGHRPQTQPYHPDGEDVPGWVVMHCRACDGPCWHIVAPGDEPFECDLWREYRNRMPT